MHQYKRDSACLFCKIIGKEIPSAIVKESDNFVAIRDISPQAPTHILVLPKNHLTDITQADNAQELGKYFQAATEIAKEENLTNGFRLVVNTGAQSGQTVFHLHIHILGGREMLWPPG